MQQLLFELDTDTMPISLIASELRASEASVRNWIKTGYLHLNENKQVTRASYDSFRCDVIGKDKLIKRANKKFIGANIQPVLTKESDEPVICLSALYEKSIPENVKNIEGIFYTPESITGDFFRNLPLERSNLIFCDPCCGTGNFLVAAIRNGFSAENVYGYDTDENAIIIAQKRLSKFAKFTSKNLEVLDFLNFSSSSSASLKKFDVILTNPPWGKKLTKLERDFFGRTFSAGKSLDTCSLFFLAALRNLKNEGYCGFLLPESFFNIATFEAVRHHILNLKIISICDYGKPFVGVISKAVGMIVQNIKVHNNTIFCESWIKKNVQIRQQTQFKLNPSAIINFQSTSEEALAIEHIMRRPYITLKGRAKWGLGIVTGNNARFVRKQAEIGFMPVWKGSDITLNGLKKPSSFIPTDLSLYQQVAATELYTAQEKLIYKFISSRLEFFHDTKQRYVLNSANFLIPLIDNKFSQQYLVDYLNSKVLNWVFQSIFRTYKVLRGDLESLPLFIDFIQSDDCFNESTLCAYLGIEETKDGTFRIAGPTP
jgi:site-specific DNA-methyltransferase (adenine-specific)